MKVTQAEAIDQLKQAMKTDFKGAKLLQFSTEEVGDNQIVRAALASPLGSASIVEITVTKTEFGVTADTGKAATDDSGKPVN